MYFQGKSQEQSNDEWKIVSKIGMAKGMHSIIYCSINAFSNDYYIVQNVGITLSKLVRHPSYLSHIILQPWLSAILIRRLGNQSHRLLIASEFIDLDISVLGAMTNQHI